MSVIKFNQKVNEVKTKLIKKFRDAGHSLDDSHALAQQVLFEEFRDYKKVNAVKVD